jgi:hypothetical protein
MAVICAQDGSPRPIIFSLLAVAFFIVTCIPESWMKIDENLFIV